MSGNSPALGSPLPEATHRRSRIALGCAGLLLLANIVVPLIGGDVYPFTSAPMFRDCPTEICNYHVFAPDGRELPAADWLVHRVYDGNPLGYGVGVQPPAVIEQRYGEIHDAAAVCEHIAQHFASCKDGSLASVKVTQDVIGPLANGSVGVIRSQSWVIERPANEPAPKAAQ